MEYHLDQRIVPKVEFRFTRQVSSTIFVYMKLLLRDVEISSVTLDIEASSAAAMETVTFDYTIIEVEYYHSSTGSTSVFVMEQLKYDIVNDRPV